MPRHDLSAAIGHPTRTHILDLVRREPGVPCAPAARRLGIDYSTLQYHVRILARHAALQVVTLGGVQRLYPPGAAPARDERVVLDALASDTALHVANTVLMRGHATLRDVMLTLDIPRTTAQNHLRRLAEVGLLHAAPWRDTTRPTVYTFPDAAS